MAQRLEYGSRSLAAAGGAVMLAQSFHSVMLAPAWLGETGAWLAVLLAGLVATGLLWIVVVGLRPLPDASLIGLARTALGRPGAVVTSLLVAGALVYHLGFVLRQTAEMAVSAVYPLTPQSFAVIALLLPIFLGARVQLNPLVRLARLLFPWLAAAILFIVIGVVGWGEWRNLLPLWGPGFGPLLIRSVPLVALYTPGLFILMAAKQVHDRQDLWQSVLIVGAGAGILYALGEAMMVMTYTFPVSTSITFPLHEMARLILGGRFFQRVEGVWVLIWVLATVCHGALLLHVAAAAVAEGFGMPTHRTAVLPLITMVLTIAYLPADQTEAVAWHMAGAPLGGLATFGWPLLLVPIAAWRRRGQRVET